MSTQVINPIGDNVSRPGCITPIPDAEHNKQIIALARWAVDEYNKEHKACLRLVKVIYAAEQMVSGIMYYITMNIADDSHLCVRGQGVGAAVYEFQEVGGISAN